MTKRKQVVVIHGGDSFDSEGAFLRALRKWPVTVKMFLPKRPGWKEGLQEKLGSRYQVLMPQMPNKFNAHYAAWKVWFEKMFPYLRNDLILVGHSQGGIFLMKYLSEKRFPRRIWALITVAAPHNGSENVGDFRLRKSLRNVAKQVPHIVLFHSPGDPIVPFSEVRTYKKVLPAAEVIVVKHRGHFAQRTFPELIRLIKRLAS